MSLKTIVILTPVYNDWHSFLRLMRDVDQCAGDLKDVSIDVIAINDGSTESLCRGNNETDTYKHIREISVLHLARNLGHQKAIALGIAYINSNIRCDLVIVMDADGEDRPADIAKLLEESNKSPGYIIFARRARRSEGLVFRVFYFLYKIFFHLLTGREIAFGNFSFIPGGLLNRVAHLPEIWNHFAAGIMHANIPCLSIPTQRGKRYAGKSSMSFITLVIHGLSAISVYIEILTVRLMLLAIVIILIGIVGFFVLLYVKYITPLAIPGWATNVAIGIVVIMFQAILLLALLTFLSLNYRSSKLFIPAKDYQDYLLELEKIMSDNQTYIGQELTIFAHAANWKKYYSSIIQPFFGKRVIEVGAGIGSTTAVMCNGIQEEWLCLEPDPVLRTEIDQLIYDGKLPACCRTQVGFVADIPPENRFDTFIYIDVLEHIKDDRAELEAAAVRLSSGGRLIVLSPAFNFLYSSFDRSIGHYRRYDKKMFHALTPGNCRVEKMIYLDSVGTVTSLVNRLFLSQSMPTVRQIIFWDHQLVPIAKRLDRLINYGFGRSLLGIWKKDEAL